MGLFTEAIAEELELRILRGECDILGEGGSIRSITTDYEYTKTNKIKYSKILEEIKNKDEKVIQSKEILTECKTNNKGDIVRATQFLASAPTETILGQIEIKNLYTGPGVNNSKIVRKIFYGTNKKPTGRVDYIYNVRGKIILKQSIGENEFEQYHYHYDDDDEYLTKVTYISNTSKDQEYGMVPIARVFEINRNGNGYINSIHLQGGGEYDSEFFRWYEDGTVEVTKGKPDDEGILVYKEKLYFSTIN